VTWVRDERCELLLINRAVKNICGNFPR